jgi:group II intron reverse transcriptase/maturase
MSELLDKILHKDNMNEAYKKVCANKGAGGVDGVSTEELGEYIKTNWPTIKEQILRREYKPQPVRRVEIPKPNGGKRKLGIPTAMDRVIQQAIVQVIGPICDPHFSEFSYGFRPNRSCEMAIRKVLEYLNEDYTWIVDIDLEKFFDNVPQDRLMSYVHILINDGDTESLIRKYLKAGVMTPEGYEQTEMGTPQGGNLSPLLSNIYLTAFDRMLESRGHKFVRYADDCNIYVKSRRAAERVMASCIKFLEGTLKLTVNQKKSQVGSPLKLKFLGFSLYKTKKKAGIRPHRKSIKRFKDKIRELTSRKQARSVELILKRLKRYTTGWLGYYSIADMESHMKRLTEWVRRRIRQIYWKQWKKPKCRHDNLVRLGIPNSKAWEWAQSGKGYWRIADSYVLHRSLTNEYLASVGYDDILNRYKVLHSNY